MRDWLREKPLADVHRQMYENRPIHWPLSSAKKTFVAWVTIHRWNAQRCACCWPTICNRPSRGSKESSTICERRDGPIAKRPAAPSAVCRRAALGESWPSLSSTSSSATSTARRRPARSARRARPTRYAPDLDDGVMINSAALWPLLAAQWKDPAKWWQQLTAAQGKKDYDWSHLAMVRYSPMRVDAKCQADPSLGVAHGCFWKYHPQRAWTWELRLQDEIAQDFRIEEEPYRGDGGDGPHRDAYIAENADEAFAAVAKELNRRLKKHAGPIAQMQLLETGIWSAAAVPCWELEMKTIQKQQADFQLTAPYAEKSRSAYAKAHPQMAAQRAELLAAIQTGGLLFGDDDEEGAA